MQWGQRPVAVGRVAGVRAHRAPPPDQEPVLGSQGNARDAQPMFELYRLRARPVRHLGDGVGRTVRAYIAEPRLELVRVAGGPLTRPLGGVARGHATTRKRTSTWISSGTAGVIVMPTSSEGPASRSLPPNRGSLQMLLQSARPTWSWNTLESVVEKLAKVAAEDDVLAPHSLPVRYAAKKSQLLPAALPWTTCHPAAAPTAATLSSLDAKRTSGVPSSPSTCACTRVRRGRRW